MKRSILLLGFLIVLLVLPFFQISNVSATPQQYEYYNTDDDTYSALYGVIWKAQTFTVGAVGHTVTSVKLKMFRVYVPPSGDPGTVTVSIRAVSSSGHPTGSDLTSGTIAGGSFTSNTAGAWYTITLTEYTLSASTTYAIVVRALTGTSSNYVAWRYDGTDPIYEGGNFESSSNSGSTWTSYGLRDFMFEVWGNPLPDTTKPTYSNVGTNTTIAGQPCLFYTKWTDETGLATTGGFIFGTNNTGTPTNETWTAFTANPDWSNKTKTLNSTVGIRVEWWVYANDTSNNWNNTGTQYLITASGKAWHTVSTWTASLVTRTWSSGTSWTANLIARMWSNVGFFVSTDLIDSYSESHFNDSSALRVLHPSSGWLTSDVGQSFTMLPSDHIITSCKFYLSKYGSPTGMAHAVLYAHSGTYGTNSTPTGDALATSDDFDVSTLSSSPELITFTFNSSQEYQMSANTYYCIDFEDPRSGFIDWDNCLLFGYALGSPTHSGNTFLYYYSSFFAAPTSEDLIFYVYGRSLGGFNLLTRQYLTVASWLFDFGTRIWVDAATWTYNWVTMAWQNITWILYLGTSIWTDIATLGINLSAMLWNDVATWIFYPLTRLWRDLTWLFTLLPALPEWVNVALWIFSLTPFSTGFLLIPLIFLVGVVLFLMAVALGKKFQNEF